MGSNASQPQPSSLNHLTTNTAYQNLLLGVYRNNDQYNFNQMYYNMQNPNQSLIDPFMPISIKKSTPQKIKLSLHKKTLQLVLSGDNSKLYSITFTFSSTVPVILTFYPQCTEELDSQNLRTSAIISRKSENMKEFHFPPGKKVIFPVETYYFDNQASKPQNNEYYLVIKLETEGNEEKEVIYTYCGMSEIKGKIEVIKQKIDFPDKALLMHEIYGCNYKEYKENEDGLCSICLTDRIDIIIFPCEHMCVCYKCCLDLRVKTSKCPICRNKIDSFIKVQKNRKKEEKK